MFSEGHEIDEIDNFSDCGQDVVYVAMIDYKVVRWSWSYFISNGQALFYLIVVVLLTLSIPAIDVIFSYIYRDLFNSLQNRNQHGFNMALLKFFIFAFPISVPVSVLKNYTTQLLSANWRKELTDSALKKYYSNKIYYILETNPHSVDNPDQRISEDIRDFTDISVKYFLLLCGTLVNFLLFSLVLLSLSPLLFVIVITYSIIGTSLTHLIGVPLYHMYFSQMKYESNFRFFMARTRDNAESIAFYNHHDNDAVVELANSRSLFTYVYEIQLKVITKQLHLEFFTKR